MLPAAEIVRIAASDVERRARSLNVESTQFRDGESAAFESDIFREGVFSADVSQVLCWFFRASGRIRYIVDVS